jgi:hypothetical protein
MSSTKVVPALVPSLKNSSLPVPEAEASK